LAKTLEKSANIVTITLTARKNLQEKKFGLTWECILCLTNECLFAAAIHCTATGLPDGLFSNQKSQFGSIWEGLRLENVNIFYGHLKYFTDIWDNL
jgi:hypothetical protein